MFNKKMASYAHAFPGAIQRESIKWHSTDGISYFPSPLSDDPLTVLKTFKVDSQFQKEKRNYALFDRYDPGYDYHVRLYRSFEPGELFKDGALEMEYAGRSIDKFPFMSNVRVFDFFIDALSLNNKKPASSRRYLFHRDMNFGNVCVNAAGTKFKFIDLSGLEEKRPRDIVTPSDSDSFYYMISGLTQIFTEEENRGIFGEAYHVGVNRNFTDARVQGQPYKTAVDNMLILLGRMKRVCRRFERLGTPKSKSPSPFGKLRSNPNPNSSPESDLEGLSTRLFGGVTDFGASGRGNPKNASLRGRLRTRRRRSRWTAARRRF